METHKNCELEIVSAKNELFLSPIPHLPAAYPYTSTIDRLNRLPAPRPIRRTARRHHNGLLPRFCTLAISGAAPHRPEHHVEPWARRHPASRRGVPLAVLAPIDRASRSRRCSAVPPTCAAPLQRNGLPARVPAWAAVELHAERMQHARPLLRGQLRLSPRCLLRPLETLMELGIRPNPNKFRDGIV